MMNIRTNFLISLILVIASSSVMAGRAKLAGVHVWTYSRYAQGSISDARHAPNNKEYIGCRASYSDSGNNYIRCEARDKDKRLNACYSFHPLMLTAVSSINDGSFIEFQAFANGKCRFVAIDNSSIYVNK